jgi:hypothetical protein
MDAVYLLVFAGDIYVQLVVGYVTNSAIILNRRRVVTRYTHYYIYFDLLLILILTGTLATMNYNANWGKILIMYKFLRMFELDQLILRRLSIHKRARLFYEISKQFVTLFVLAQLWGIFFFLIDNYMLNTYEPCQNGGSCNFCFS